jgi:hypothetical protein
VRVDGGKHPRGTHGQAPGAETAGTAENEEPAENIREARMSLSEAAAVAMENIREARMSLSEAAAVAMENIHEALMSLFEAATVAAENIREARMSLSPGGNGGD